MNEDKLQGKAEKYFNKGKWVKALKAFCELREMKPADLRIRLKIAETLLRLERLDEAKILFRQVAGLYSQDGQLHKAIAINHRLLEFDRDDREVQTKLAALYEHHQTGIQKDLPLAPEEVDQTISEMCREDIQEKVIELQNKIQQAMMRSSFKEALEEATKLWKMAPANLPTRLTIARILEALKRKEEALLIYLHVAQQYLREGKILGAIFVQANLNNDSQVVSETFQNKRRELIKKISIVYGRFEDRHTKGPVGSQRFTKLEFLPFRARSEIMEEVLENLLIDPIDLGKIQAVPLLSELPRRECSALIERLRPLHVQKGKVIFEQEETAHCLYVVSEGQVGLYPQTGKDLAMQTNPQAVVQERELLGTFGFLFDGKRHQSAFAQSPVDLLVLTRDDYAKLCQSFPLIQERFDRLYRQTVLTQLFRRNGVFQHFPEKMLEQMAQAFSVLRKDMGGFELKEGQSLESLYFLREGIMDVFCGKVFHNQPLATIGPGTFIGPCEWLAGAVLPLTFRASGPITLLALNRADLPEDLTKDLGQKEALEHLLRNEIWHGNGMGTHQESLNPLYLANLV